MSENFEYITTDGERWDQIAYKAYGVVTLVDDAGIKRPAMQMIIEANATVPVTDKLPGGVILQVPVLATNSAKTATELTPPWKRNL